jgi:nitrogenase molybdenum-iron protein NifN
MVSPADLRHLRDILMYWGADAVILPDYSETLDGPAWADYERMPAGGTTVNEIRSMAGATAVIEFGRVLAGDAKSAGALLASRCGLPLHRLGLPVGVRETDRLFAALESATGRPAPARLLAERGRLIDSYVDAHKYLAAKRAVVYGEDDLVVAIASFLAETGIVPVLCASGSRSGRLAAALSEALPEMEGRITVREGADFAEIESLIPGLSPDLLIGSSKGRKLARSLGIPLVVCGFPIHDRIGAQRIQVLAHAGTQQLFDRITNALLEVKQEKSSIGYSYL